MEQKECRLEMDKLCVPGELIQRLEVMDSRSRGGQLAMGMMMPFFSEMRHGMQSFINIYGHSNLLSMMREISATAGSEPQPGKVWPQGLWRDHFYFQM